MALLLPELHARPPGGAVVASHDDDDDDDTFSCCKEGRRCEVRLGETEGVSRVRKCLRSHIGTTHSY